MSEAEYVAELECTALLLQQVLPAGEAKAIDLLEVEAGVARLITELATVKAERDDLLAACEAAATYVETFSGWMGGETWVLNKLRAAIARATATPGEGAKS